MCAQEPDEEIKAESGYEVGQPSRLVYAPPAGTWENENPAKAGAGFKKDIIQEVPKAYRQKIFFSYRKVFFGGLILIKKLLTGRKAHRGRKGGDELTHPI